jgi:hypothetical protein
MARGGYLRPWLACAALTVMACGSPPSAGDAPPAADAPQPTPTARSAPTNTENACELLTRADAESTLGSSIEDDADESSLSPMGDKALQGSCYYEGDGGSVKLTVVKHVDAAYASERFARLRDRHDTDPSFRSLSSLGDEAFAEHDFLHVRRSDLILSIQLRRTGERKLKHFGDKLGLDALAADERTIAEEALKRLPPVTRS